MNDDASSAIAVWCSADIPGHVQELVTRHRAELKNWLNQFDQYLPRPEGSGKREEPTLAECEAVWEVLKEDDVIMTSLVRVHRALVRWWYGDRSCDFSPQREHGRASVIETVDNFDWKGILNNNSHWKMWWYITLQFYWEMWLRAESPRPPYVISWTRFAGSFKMVGVFIWKIRNVNWCPLWGRIYIAETTALSNERGGHDTDTGCLTIFTILSSLHAICTFITYNVVDLYQTAIICNFHPAISSYI